MMKVLVLILAVLLSACATTPSERATYLLRSDKGPVSGEVLSESNVYLGGLTLANYISQQGIVLETAPGQIHEARFHQWAEPLSVSLRGFLGAEVSASLGQDLAVKESSQRTVRLDVNIDQMHGTMEGEALLTAHWSITDSNGSRRFRYVNTSVLKDDGYNALVIAQRHLLEQFALAISESLQGAL
jgi:uncharacterized lipoprotein YmbA